MQKSFKPWLRLVTGLLLVIASQSVYSANDSEQNLTAAWNAVNSGKAVVLMRHALAPGTGDPTGFDVDLCSTQRNLSDVGRTQAKAIGDVLRSNGVVEATILSSQWCRCLETATLLDFGDPVPTPMINSFFQDWAKEPAQTELLLGALRHWVQEQKGSKILVTHQVNISALTGKFAGSGDMLIVTIENDEPLVLAQIATE